MTNHVHMLIQVGDAPLGGLMLRIAGRYARAVQKKLDTTGHLFEKRYHPVLVDADEYLLELLRYVHLNPVRAHMVKHPADYPWSSHHAYLGAAQHSWITTDFALGMFHPQRDRAITEYQHFIDRHVAAPSVSPLLECNPSDSRILGNDEFARRLRGAVWRPRSRRISVPVVGLSDRSVQKLDDRGVSDNPTTGTEKAGTEKAENAWAPRMPGWHC